MSRAEDRLMGMERDKKQCKNCRRMYVKFDLRMCEIFLNLRQKRPVKII
jgi:hypothetical protein